MLPTSNFLPLRMHRRTGTGTNAGGGTGASIGRPMSNNHLMFASSSHMLCRAFPRYTKTIRRLFSRFSFMHRLALFALFISVLLAFVLSLAAHMTASTSAAATTSSTRVISQPPPSLPQQQQQQQQSVDSIDSIDMPLPDEHEYEIDYQNKSNTVFVSSNTPRSNDFRFEDHLIRTQVYLQKLPHTTWHYSHALDQFRPFLKRSTPESRTNKHDRKQHTSDMRLITLNDACYCTHRNQFIIAAFQQEDEDEEIEEQQQQQQKDDDNEHSLHHYHSHHNHHRHRYHKKNKKKPHFPAFLFRHGAARLVKSSHPRHVLAFPSQKTVFLSGVTILWRGRSLRSQQTNAQQVHRALLPIRSVLDILSSSSSSSRNINGETYIIGEDMTSTSSLQDYYIGDIPLHNRMSMSKLRPRLVCFQRVIALGSEYDGHAAPGMHSHDRMKMLVEQTENLSKHTLARDCDDKKSANTKTVWIIHRQATKEDTASGVLRNVAQVETTVNHELLALQKHIIMNGHGTDNNNHDENDNDDDNDEGYELNMKVHVVQAPNSPCPDGSMRQGCIDVDCNDHQKQSCLRSRRPRRHSRQGVIGNDKSTLDVVRIFNNMTFVITTSGQANHGFAFMPAGSHVIEVVPYGVLEPSYERVAKEAGLVYHRIQSKLSKSVQQSLFQRFGDVASSPKDCWDDAECRAARLNTETVVDVRQLASLLKSTLPKWWASCGRKQI